jgi:hypothetical protein
VKDYSWSPALSLPLTWLLEELEGLIENEFKNTGNPWVSKVRLTELFYEKHGSLPENIADLYDCSLKNILRSSNRFSIYNIVNPELFYVALYHSFPQFKPKTKIKSSSKQYCSENNKIEYKLNGHESLVNSPHLEPLETIQEYSIRLPSEISSINDFEIYLIEIVRILTKNNSNNFVSVAVLSRKFCNCYGQPIRSVMRTICPDMKLVELLQVIPDLHVENIEDDFKITIAIPT